MSHSNNNNNNKLVLSPSVLSPRVVKIERLGRRRCAMMASVGCIALMGFWQARMQVAVSFSASSRAITFGNDKTNHYHDNSNNNTAHQPMIDPLVSSLQSALEEQPHDNHLHSTLNSSNKEHNNIHNITGIQQSLLQSEKSSVASTTPEENLDNTAITLQPAEGEEEEKDLPRPHPHAGAKDENGQWGYIHDPTYVKNHPLPFSHGLGGRKPPICATPFGEGEELALGYEGLKLVEVANETTIDTTPPRPKVLCIIYTHSGRHDTLLKTVVETYAPYCDGFMAASNQTNRTLGAVDLPHEGPESYHNMWNKVRSIWAYVQDNYSNDFDYFHLGGDDMYVIPQNLRQYVATLSTSSSWFQHIGGIIGGSNWRTYCGGASGYTFNRATLKYLVEDVIPACGADRRTSMEDIMISNCFLRRNRLRHCHDTRDANQATRYHQLTAAWQMEWGGLSPNILSTTKLMEVHNFTYLSGAPGLSRSSISFHLKHRNVEHMIRSVKRYHVILFPSVCQSWKTATATKLGQKVFTVSSAAASLI